MRLDLGDIRLYGFDVSVEESQITLDVRND
jgi:hypothetical protein